MADLASIPLCDVLPTFIIQVLSLPPGVSVFICGNIKHSRRGLVGNCHMVTGNIRRTTWQVTASGHANHRCPVSSSWPWVDITRKYQGLSRSTVRPYKAMENTKHKRAQWSQVTGHIRLTGGNAAPSPSGRQGTSSSRRTLLRTSWHPCQCLWRLLHRTHNDDIMATWNIRLLNDVTHL